MWAVVKKDSVVKRFWNWLYMYAAHKSCFRYTRLAVVLEVLARPIFWCIFCLLAIKLICKDYLMKSYDYKRERLVNHTVVKCVAHDE